MRLRTLTSICFGLGTVMLIGTPWILRLNPAKLTSDSALDHHKSVVAFSGLVLSYSAAELMFFVSSAFFAILLILEMQEAFRADRLQNYQVFLEGAQADLQKQQDSRGADESGH